MFSCEPAALLNTTPAYSFWQLSLKHQALNNSHLDVIMSRQTLDPSCTMSCGVVLNSNLPVTLFRRVRRRDSSQEESGKHRHECTSNQSPPDHPSLCIQCPIGSDTAIFSIQLTPTSSASIQNMRKSNIAYQAPCQADASIIASDVGLDTDCPLFLSHIRSEQIRSHRCTLCCNNKSPKLWN